MQIKDENFRGKVVSKVALNALKEIMLKRIFEKEKTDRLLIVITAVIILFVATILIFSHKERQITSTIIRIVLIIFALESIGTSQLALKLAGWEISALTKNIQLKSEIQSSSNPGEKIKSESGYPIV